MVQINDKRRFKEDGTSKGESSTCDSCDPKESCDKQETCGCGDHHNNKGASLHEIDFSTFVLSLATSAQVHLGLVANPASGKQGADLPLAKQTIDILGILQDKTKGNLEEEENRLLEHLLYDLRMIYVEKNK